MHLKTAYACDYCDKPILYKPAAFRHEKNCLHNPAHRACRSCRWWFMNRPTYGTRGPLQGKGHFLPFCSNPDEDYSLEVDHGYGECPDQEYNVVRKGCVGWVAIKQWERNMRIRLKEELCRRYEVAI